MGFVGGDASGESTDDTEASRVPERAAARNSRTPAVLAAGLAAILSVFVLPVFLLKLLLLLGGVACVAYALLPLALGPDRARQAALALAVLGTSFGVSLVLGEFAVRMAFADVTTTPVNNSYFDGRWGAGRSEPNSLGYREREVASPAPEGVYRIAVIGDSFTWGQGIERSDRMTERLEALLKGSSPNIEVLNFGRPGAETVDHVQTLRDVVLPLKPDFVLMQWYSNDVEGRDKSAWPTAARLIPSETAASWLGRRSALYYLVDQQWQKLQRGLGLVGSYLDYMDVRFGDPASPDMIRAKGELLDFVTLARADSVGVGIVTYPSVITADSVDDFPLAYLFDRVMEFCTAAQIDCLDLRHAFVGISETEGWWASRLDPHPGPLANGTAAAAVATHFGERWASEASRH